MDLNKNDRLNSLLKRWYEHQLTQSEEQEFFELINQADETGLSEPLKEIWESVKEEPFYSGNDKEVLVQKIIPAKKGKVFLLLRIAAAAILILLIGGVILRYFNNDKSELKLADDDMSVLQPILSDIKAPETNKATLTLSDGRKLVIDSAAEGMLVTEGNISVEKSKQGALVYSGTGEEIKYHTLTVPRGSKPFQLTLPDGTRVTVNVASSLTYPTAFSATSRLVKVTGEAYFDVVHKESGIKGGQPFIVKVNGIEVHVLGTRFNVNAYDDENAVKTTLLEGLVDIKSGNDQQSMTPNQQAIVLNGQDGKIKLVRDADVDEAMAWINGKFRFTDAGVEAVMRQVSRWYDVEVVYSAKPLLRFGGQIDRNSTLRQMLTILQTSGLHFRIEENKVIILP